jgi:GT2 family glycosyltransferase
MSPTTVTVVVPTYMRHETLVECLTALAVQAQPADEVIVVRRPEDRGAGNLIAEFPIDIVEVLVDVPGQLHALIAGAAQANSHVVAFTDDDARPRPEWVSGIRRHFEGDPTIVGVGGRDVIPAPQQTRARDPRVGIVTAWGTVIGNHHLARGEPRDVDVLKGVNMAYRRSRLVFAEGLRGAGAQVHNEVAQCLAIVRGGGRLVFDPDLKVDHAGAPRTGADQRTRPKLSAVFDASYNLTASLLAFRRGMLWRHLAVRVALGDTTAPGLARFALALVRRDMEVARRWLPALAGCLVAVARSVRAPVVTVRGLD